MQNAGSFNLVIGKIIAITKRVINYQNGTDYKDNDGDNIGSNYFGKIVFDMHIGGLMISFKGIVA
jgi:hypothetical protein